MKYTRLINEVVNNVGGEKNINSVVNCATRLRFTVYDEEKVNAEKIEKIDGVIKYMHVGNQHQVVIGQHVSDVYNELMKIYCFDDIDEYKEMTEFKEDMKNKKVKSSLIDIISGIFSPILGVMMATGFIKGLLVLLEVAKILTPTSGTYQILYMIGNVFFYFIPVYLGYTSSKKFGGNPMIGMTIGLILLYPSIAEILDGEPVGTIFNGIKYHIDFLGIPVVLRNYSSTVFPVIIISYIASKLEIFLKKNISPLVSSFAVPGITLLVSVVLGFIVVGPIIATLSEILGNFIIWIFEVSSFLGGFIYGLLIQLCVVFGIHWGFVTIAINNITTMGFDPITITGLCSVFGQMGVVTVILLKTKNKKIKSLGVPALISGLFGISEPMVYGVTLQNKTAFILASIASGFGGAIMALVGVKQYTMGANGIFGWMQVINPEKGFDNTVLITIISCILSYVIAVILMSIFGKKSLSKIENVQ